MNRNPSAAEVRDLRNEFRQLVGDETLEQSKEQCGVCALDRRSSATSSTRLTSGVRLAVAEPEQAGSGKALWVVGAVAAGILILFLLKKSKQ